MTQGNRPTLPVGERINRYEILGVMGSGGFGTVYRVRHAVLQQDFALKTLHPTRNENSVKRFVREARTAAALGSDHIVKVTDAGETDAGLHFLVMELLEGRSLRTVLAQDGPLSIGRAVALVQQVLTGLEAAHSKSIVHRDLKPDNIFVIGDSSAGEVAKILDFGISRMRLSGTALTQSGALLGTPRFMAPEQFIDAKVDERADLFSLTVVLYNILSGGASFRRKNASRNDVAHAQRRACADRKLGRPGSGET